MSYIPQLARTNEEVEKCEKSAIERILKPPHHAINNSAPFLLDEIGIRTFRSIENASLAALVRTACFTAKGWHKCWKELDRARKSSANTHKEMDGILVVPPKPKRRKALHMEGEAKSGKDNPWWKWRAFVDNLAEAEHLFPQVQRVKKDFQANINKEINKERRVSNLASELLPRVLKILGTETASEEERARIREDMEFTVKTASEMAPSLGVAVVRTWTNGWCTETRFGTETLARSSCRFGCEEGADQHRHYACCHPLGVIVAKHVSDNTGTPWRTTQENFLCVGKGRDGGKEPTDARRAKIQALAVAVDVFNVTAKKQNAGEEARPLPTQTLVTRVREAVRRLERVTTFVDVREPKRARLADESDGKDKGSKAEDGAEVEAPTAGSTEGKCAETDGRKVASHASEANEGIENKNPRRAIRRRLAWREPPARTTRRLRTKVLWSSQT